MKRSSMVLLIAEVMVSPRYEDAKANADLLLRVLERNGMLPPLIDGPAPLEFSDFCWEPEDEEE